MKSATRAVIDLLRPANWIKNSVVFLGAMSATSAIGCMFWWRVALAISTCCLLSSAGYVVNDILDADYDRADMVKRSRPVAAELITTRSATAIVVALCAVAFPMAWALGWGFLLRATVYFALSVAYSLCLKNVPYVEIASVTTGFLVRFDAGSAVINGRREPLLFAALACAIIFLAASKRMKELSWATSPFRTRPVLRAYSLPHLRISTVIAGFAAVSLFLVYGFTAKGTILAGQMAFTLPLMLLGFARYLFLVLRRTPSGDPTALLTHDRVLRYIFILWVAAVAVSLVLQ